MRNLHEDQYTFLTISYLLRYRMRNVQKKTIEKIKTHFVFNDFSKIMLSVR